MKQAAYRLVTLEPGGVRCATKRRPHGAPFYCREEKEASTAGGERHNPRPARLGKELDEKQNPGEGFLPFPGIFERSGLRLLF